MATGRLPRARDMVLGISNNGRGRKRRRRHAGMLRGMPGGREDTLLVAFVLSALLLGGAGPFYPLAHWLVTTLGLAVLALLVPKLRWSNLHPRLKLATGLIGAGFALCLAQMIPLPRGLWQGMAGHALAAQVTEVARTGGWIAWSLSPDRTLTAMLALIPSAAAMLAMARASGDLRRTLLRLVLAIALASAVLAVIQLAFGSGSAPVVFETRHRGFGVGLFVNRNHLALFLLIAMQIAALPEVLVPRPKDENARAAEWGLRTGALVLLSLGVVATLSRAGCSLLPVALASAILLSRRRRLSVATLLAILAGAVVAVLLLRSAPPVEALLGRFATAAEDKRFEYWANTAIAIRDSLPWGTGFGTFQLVYPTVEPLNEIYPDVVNHAHNDLLELVLEGGVAAALMLLAWLGFIGWAVVRARKCAASRFERLAPLAVGVSLVLAVAASAVDYPLRMSSISVTLGLLVGLLLPATSPAEDIADVAPAGYRRWTVTALAAALGLLALTTQWADRLALAGHESWGAVIAPWSSEVQAGAATRYEGLGRPIESSMSARKALAVSPLNPAALRAEGMAALALDRRDQGAALMSLGARLGWREGITQLWLIEQALGAGANGFAVQRIDGLLRQDKFSEQLLPFLPSMMRTADGRAALAEQLAFQPGWRLAFFNTVARDQAWTMPQLFALADVLRRSGAPILPAETALIRAVVADGGRFADARRIWLMTGQAGLIGDGDFEAQRGELPPGAAPFAWRTLPLPGVRLEVAEPTIPRSGLALSIASEGVGHGAALAQTLVLGPGRYSIRLAGLTQQPQLLRQVRFALGCRYDARGPLQAPPLVPLRWAAVANQWSVAKGTFEVPANCPGQDFVLAIPDNGGRPFSIWVDVLSIVQVRQPGA